ncbi:MAG: SH3 domain-containing protein [Roseobacter sp.]
MNRFIFLVFGFLALAFYEFSGGADFSPTATRMAAVEGRQQASGDDLPLAVTEPEVVARADLNLVSFSEISPPTEATVVREDPPLQFAPIAVSLEAATRRDDPAPQAAGVAVLGETVEASVQAAAPAVTAAESSIRFEGRTSSAASERVAAALQTRLVNGSLVNVRSGPGTTYGVVSQLSRGDEVEILSDNGAGWVKMRPANGGPEGWMADFLLSR